MSLSIFQSSWQNRSHQNYRCTVTKRWALATMNKTCLSTMTERTWIKWAPVFIHKKPEILNFQQHNLRLHIRKCRTTQIVKGFKTAINQNHSPKKVLWSQYQHSQKRLKGRTSLLDIAILKIISRKKLEAAVNPFRSDVNQQMVLVFTRRSELHARDQFLTAAVIAQEVTQHWAVHALLEVETKSRRRVNSLKMHQIPNWRAMRRVKGQIRFLFRRTNRRLRRIKLFWNSTQEKLVQFLQLRDLKKS